MAIDDDGPGVLDLTWVKQWKDEPEQQGYLCRLCTDGPDSVLIKVVDPEMLKFVEAGVTRWICTRCGFQIDEVPENMPQLRRQERVSTILGDNKAKSGPILETVRSETKDISRGTKHSRQSETNLDLEPGDESELTCSKQQDICVNIALLIQFS